VNIIEVGDKVVNHAGAVLTVREVHQGKYGIFIEGTFDSGARGGSYFPPEMLPVEAESPWYGFGGASYAVLPSGAKVGVVAFRQSDPRAYNVDEYDAEWKRTLETMRLEKMSGTHTPDNTLQSRPFTEQSRPDVL